MRKSAHTMRITKKNKLLLMEPTKPDNIDITQQPTCYLICGFLGAGKTTYSKNLAEKTGAIHLNPDEWCMIFFDKAEYEKNWGICFSETIALLWEKAAEYANQNKSVIFDMGFWTKQSREEACQKANELGFEPVIHYVYAPDHVLKARISQRSGVIADYNLKHFNELKKQFEEPASNECVVRIDNRF